MSDFLSVPRVVGPVSVLSTAVRVQRHLDGATVEILGRGFRGDRVVARGTPSSPGDGVLALLGGIRLEEGERLAARQEAGRLKSGETPLENQVVVLGMPSSLGAATVHTDPYECGQCLYVDGVYPGATVEALDIAGARGRVEALGTIARIALTRPLTVSDTIRIEQRTNAGVVASTALGPVERAPLVSSPSSDPRPPPPRLASVMACAETVLIEGIVPGAAVELLHYKPMDLAPTPLVGCVDTRAVYFVLPKTERGDRLQARQALCELSSDVSNTVDVTKQSLGTPSVTPPCARDTRVVVHGLEIGADVIVTTIKVAAGVVDIDTYRGRAYAPSSIVEVPKGAFQGALIHAVQTRCGETSAASASVPSEPVPTDEPVPRIPGPVYECATKVRVLDVPPGSSVFIVSKTQARAAYYGSGVISTELFWAGPGTTVDVPVISLLKDDEIWAVVKRCGKLFSSAPAEFVRASDHLPPPDLLPVTTCGPIIARSLVPGMTTKLFVNGTLVTSVVVSERHHTFTRPRDLRAGQIVTVLQSVCGVLRSSSPTTVVNGHFKVVERATRLQQVTGQEDRGKNLPTRLPFFKDDSEKYGIIGTDLGVPIEHSGSLYLFFGDSKQYLTKEAWQRAYNDDDLAGRSDSAECPRKPSRQDVANAAPGQVIPGPFIRPVARVEDVASSSPEDGLRLKHVVDDAGHLKPLCISDPTKPEPRSADDTFYVPTGGYSYFGKLSLFMMEKAAYPKDALSNEALPVDPTISPPAAAAKRKMLRLQWAESNYPVDEADLVWGMIAARATQATNSSPAANFDATEVFDVRSVPFSSLVTEWKFAQTAPVIVKVEDVPELFAYGAFSGHVVFLFGTGAMRQSNVCLAWAPLSPGSRLPSPSEWRFFVGTSPSGSPLFGADRTAAIGLLETTTSGPTTNETSPRRLPNLPAVPSVGEFSVYYSQEIRMWIMLYTLEVSPPRIYLRVAPNPWGPWLPKGGAIGEGLVVFNQDEIAAEERATAVYPTGIYAPYVLARYCKWSPADGSLALYFLASFLGEQHGQVSLFRTRITCTPTP